MFKTRKLMIAVVLSSGLISQNFALAQAHHTKDSFDKISPVFDVASIRESEPVAQPSQFFSFPAKTSRLDADNIWVTQLIGEAFNVSYRYQLTGGPEWTSQQRYTIHARSDSSSDTRLSAMPEDQAKAEKRLMLRKLLEQRFGLRAHIEQRAGQTYHLRLMGRPALLQEAATPTDAKQSSLISSGVPTDVTLTGKQVPLKRLVDIMAYYLKAPVVDQTSLGQIYNFKVHFNAHPEAQTDSSETGPTPEQAFADQLGLKLVREKGLVPMVVIDSIQKPSAN